jgi:hypothetical protein
VTANNLHGYALDYKSDRADNESIRQTVVVQGSRSRKENQELNLDSSFVIRHGEEDTRSPVRNKASLREPFIVSCYGWL